MDTAQAAPTRLGWQVHAAQESWTGKADAKTSVLLAFEAGMALFVVPTSAWPGGHGPHAVWQTGLHHAVLVLLALALVSAGAAITPVLGPARGHRRGYRARIVYFGHLRHWRPDALARRLIRVSSGDEVRMLAEQLIVMSRINWWKYRCLQVSIGLAMLAMTGLMVSALLRASG